MSTDMIVQTSVQSDGLVWVYARGYDSEGNLQVIAGPMDVPRERAHCRLCGRTVTHESHGPFRDVVSFEEWRISGMCQHCQDTTFGTSSKPVIEDTPL